MARLFAALLLASVTIIGCRSADTSLGAFIPSDTVALAGIRMDQLRATPLYQKLRARNLLSALDDLKARTGFDPTRDVNELLIAMNGKDAVTIARGHFHPTGTAAQKAPYKGYTLYVQGDGAWTLIDPSTTLAGTTRAVRAAIDQYKIGGRSAAVKALLARARAIPSDYQVWAASDSPEAFAPPAEAGNTANLGKIFGQLDRFTIVFDLRRGFNAVATGECRTEQDAKTLSDALRGLVSLGKLSAPKGQTDLLRVYDAIQVDQQQKSVKLAASIPPELIDKLLDQAKAFDRGPARR
jgi:hypothetical protein